MLKTTAINSITLIGVSGLGWGFIGVTMGEPVTDIQKEERFNDVAVYSNPTLDKVYFKKVIDQVSLLDHLGNELKTFKQVEEINFTSFQPGTYFVKIGSAFHKIVKLDD